MTTLVLNLTPEASSLLLAMDVAASATRKLLLLTFSSCFACIPTTRRYQFPMNSSQKNVYQWLTIYQLFQQCKQCTFSVWLQVITCNAKAFDKMLTLWQDPFDLIYISVIPFWPWPVHSVGKKKVELCHFKRALTVEWVIFSSVLSDQVLFMSIRLLNSLQGNT